MNSDIAETVAPAMKNSERAAKRYRMSQVIPFGCWLVLAAGFASAVITVGRVHWYPQLDLAMTELRVRDVASAHPPLTGLIGRIGTLASPGSHPGPLSFYLLWPFYELFGASAWALEAAAACLDALAVGLAIWIAYRRGGLTMSVGVAVIMGMLMVFFGPFILLQPWNPYIPLFWWVVFLLAAWSVSCGDFPLLPIAVVAGTLCVQTHISYALLVAGVALFMVWRTWLLVHRTPHDSPDRRRGLVWSGGALIALIVLWMPPVLQQLSGSPGNVAVILRYFGNPPQAPVGFAAGLRAVFVRLNPWTLARGGGAGVVTGSVLPGAALVVVWLVSAIGAALLRRRQLVFLDIVLAIALPTCILSAARIFGPVFFYLVLWAWSLCALLIFATAWGGYVILRDRLPGVDTSRFRVALNLVLALLLVAFGARFLQQSQHVAVPPNNGQSAELGRIVSSTERALRNAEKSTGGRKPAYLIAYDDPYQLGSQAFGLLDELERAGFRVGMTTHYSVYIQPHRVLRPAQVTAELLVVVGSDVAVWKTHPGVTEVAYVDTSTPLQRLALKHLSGQAVSQLRAAGRADLIPAMTSNLFNLSSDPRVPALTRTVLTQMLRLNQPVGVFLGPPNAFSQTSPS